MSLSDRIVTLNNFINDNDTKVLPENLDPSKIKLGVLNSPKYNKSFYYVLYGRYNQTLTLKNAKEAFVSFGFDYKRKYDDTAKKYTNEKTGGWDCTLKIPKTSKYDEKIRMIYIEVLKLLIGAKVLDASSALDLTGKRSVEELTDKQLHASFKKEFVLCLNPPKKDGVPIKDPDYHYLNMKSNAGYVDWKQREKSLDLDHVNNPMNVYPKVNFSFFNEDNIKIKLNHHNVVKDLENEPNDTWLAQEGYAYKVITDIPFTQVTNFASTYYMKPTIVNGMWKREKYNSEPEEDDIDEEDAALAFSSCETSQEEKPDAEETVVDSSTINDLMM